MGQLYKLCDLNNNFLDEEIHCDDGPARIVKYLEHRTLMAEEKN